MILDPLIGGIAMGCIYSLIALGYNMLIQAMNLLHFAQGEVMMVGALSGVTLVSALHVPYLVAIPLIMVLCAALSLALPAIFVASFHPGKRAIFGFLGLFAFAVFRPLGGVDDFDLVLLEKIENFID